MVTLRELEEQIPNERHDEAWAALGMIREALEELGVAASLESRQHVLDRGPDLTHEAEAIVEAIDRVRLKLEQTTHFCG